jgi:hypothetical protein
VWPFGERRSTKRRMVDWAASLHCSFGAAEQTVQVRVTEASLVGAQLSLERLQIGPYHLAVGSPPAGFELEIPLTDGIVRAPIEIRWYNWDESRRAFVLGVEFLRMEDENRATLRQALRKI